MQPNPTSETSPSRNLSCEVEPLQRVESYPNSVGLHMRCGDGPWEFGFGPGSASHPGPDQSLPVSEIGHFTDGAKNGPSNLNNDIFGKTNKQQPTVTHRETLVPNYLLFNPAPGFTTGSAEVMRPCT